MTTDMPVIRTEPLGGSPLSVAAQQGRLPQWYRAVPKGSDEWRKYAGSVAAGVSPKWLDDLRGAIAPTGRAAARLERSANGAGVVITTGQQAGLFGGPLMTLVKAISARALADELQARTGFPVAPLFWAATDDADFDEAAVVSVALEGGARELRLESRSPTGTPMSRVALDGEVNALAALLREACGSAPHADVLEAAVHAFRDGAAIGDAYVALLRRILEPLEIPVLDASHPCLAESAAPLLGQAAARADQLAAAVHSRIEEIVAAGYDPQVDEVAGRSLVFLNADGNKRRLSVREAPEFATPSARQFLSSTVLLRPVVERAILPTAAYVGGPGEVAYFAQVTGVADALGIAAPLVVPRWSMSIVEPAVRRALDKLGLDPDDLADPHAADGQLARDALPADASAALTALRDQVQSGVDALHAASGSLVPAKVFDGLARSLEHRIARAERRLLAGVKRRESDTMRRLATLRGALYPHGARQERKLSYVPFLSRHGSALLDAMLDAARSHARALVDSGAPAEIRKTVPMAP